MNSLTRRSFPVSLPFVATLTLCLATVPLTGQSGKHGWRAATDAVYLQEVGRQVRHASPIHAVAVFGGDVYVGDSGGVHRLVDGRLAPEPGPRGVVRRLVAAASSLWAIGDGQVHRRRDGAWSSLPVAGVVDFCSHGEHSYAVTSRSLLRLERGEFVPVAEFRARGPALRLTRHAETLYLLYGGGLGLFEGHRFDPVNVIDYGMLPSPVTRDLLSVGSRLIVATDRGLGVVRGMAATSITGGEGLCVEDTTCLADGFSDDYWIGTRRGAIRATRGEYQYFAGPRWLPDDDVSAVATSANAVYIGTRGGLGIIEYVPYTLAKKAAYYERHLEEWGQKRLGFVHKLFWDGSREEWLREVSDNDGGWSAHYLAAMAFKYAVTKDGSARREAVDTFRSIVWLEDMTPIDGFPARSVWAKGETGIKAQGGSGGYPAEWHDTADGKFEWKGDTSSDEIDAHFYAVPIFAELVANEEEKALAKRFLGRVARHIADNGWILRDLDGEPSRWGRWEPEYLQRPAGYYARGLNGLEALCYMRAAEHFTGDARFREGYRELVDLGYHREVLREKLTFPPEDVNHSDDRMAFFIYHTILRYEKDPFFRSLYRRSLERSWEIERIERNPYFNFIYGALTGNDCEVDEGVRHLREWPLDLRVHTFNNSHRHDLHTPVGYAAYAGGTRVLSPRERGPLRWSHNPMQYDGGSGGRVVEDPSGWLDAYWLARYYGIITAPATDDEELTTVPHRGLRLGAGPYDGPPRAERTAESAEKNRARGNR